MPELDLAFFKSLIISRQQQLSDSLDPASDNTESVELDQTRVGRLSRMDAMQMQQMDLALKRRHQQELPALTRALGRIETGEYGECFDCGELINPKRLEVDPVATLCISCASCKES